MHPTDEQITEWKAWLARIMRELEQMSHEQQDEVFRRMREHLETERAAGRLPQ